MIAPGAMPSLPVVREDLEQRIRALAPWFHNLNLGGIQTAPDHFLFDYPNNKWQRFAHAIPADLRGMTVLDIGCNAGFYSVQMKLRGAGRVVGIDSDEHFLAQARLVAEVMQVQIELRRLSVYDVAALREKFDVVLFMGVLYHLRHPLLALDLIHEHVARDLLVFQSMQRGSTKVEKLESDYPFSELKIFRRPSYPCLYFVEHQYAGDPTNWWIPNRACTEAMLRSAGFEILDHPEQEVYLCRRAALPARQPGPHAVYPARKEATHD
jgi:tRNA (mo5U34)-methyltransferase